MTPRRRARLLVPLAGLLLAACDGAASPPAPQASSSTTSPGQGTPGAPATGTSEDLEVRQVFDEVPPLHPSVDDYPAGLVDLVPPADGAVWRLPVLVAATPADRSHGLMEVPDLPRGTGMAFVFDEDVRTGFWMKNTLVPLDIVYVDDGRTVSFTSMVPCRADPCPSYPADGPFDLAVEVPAGFLDEIGFDLRWEVVLTFPA